MKPPFRYTKIKVISGYLLLFLLTVVSILFIYKKISGFTNHQNTLSTANQKLFIIGNTITGLYEAEALSNSFLQTGSSASFRKYIQIIKQVESNIDTLKEITLQPEQKVRIDTIHILLNDKIRNLKELLKVKKSQNPNEYYEKAITLIELSRDSIQEVQNIRKRIITTRDTSYIKNEKKRKGFLGLFSSRQPDSLLKVTVSSHTVLDTIHAQVPSNNRDSILNILRNTWENFQKETANLNRKISQKEYNIVSQSLLITQQLRKVLHEYEMEEIKHSIEQLNQQEKLRTTTARLLANIAIIAVLFIAFFCTLILKDISRSQRYRQELETAKAYTDRLLKIREKFLLTVSHDIKAPLSSVIGYIELLKNTPINDRQNYFLNNMKSSAEHIFQLLINLLDLSKLEANKIHPEEINFNPHHLLQEIYASFIPQAENKKLNYTCQIDEQLNQKAIGDALRIRQIIANILSNALKYTAKGGVRLEAAPFTDGKGMIVKVKDTGPGLSAEEQDLIFQEFSRLDSAKKIEGTGLGLTITLKLVKLLQGDLKIESIPGQGSTFIVSLPLKAREETAVSSSAPALPVTPEPIKALFVDDDTLQLKMVAELLKNKGVLVDTTSEARQVPELLLECPYDIVFTDIQMPVVDGFTLVKNIRLLPVAFTATLPVVALSANEEKQEQDYREAGFTAYLNKPFTSAQLIETITRLTGKTPLGPARQVSVAPPSVSPEKGYTLKYIFQFTDNDRSAVLQIVRSFISETEQNLSLFEKYIRGNQWDMPARLAHKMLPMFRQLEVKEIVPVLQQLEKSLHHPLPETEVRELTEVIIQKSNRLLSQLKTELTTEFSGQ